MKNVNEKYSVTGVVVDPVSRKKFGAEIFIEDGFIAGIEQRPDVTSPFILPGLVDSHVHIESSMLIPSKFARMAVRHGTTAVVTDPHEVANVAGEDGIKFMIENAESVPLKFYFGLPSCVPASPLEKSGAILDSSVVKRLIKEDKFYYLAEMMNFPGVINNDSDVIGKIEATKKAEKPIDGHAPGITGKSLEAYTKAGVSTDHECSTIEEAREKISRGMKIQIREGSAARNFDNLIELINESPKSVMFCTDDCHPDYLQAGHINKLMANAIKRGYDIFDLLQAICLNPREHYKISTGTLQINDPADIVVVEDLKSFKVLQTYINGNNVFNNGTVNIPEINVAPPSFKFREKHVTGNLDVVCKGDIINVIGVIKGELLTKWIKEKSPVPPGSIVKSSTENDILKIVLLDRYDSTKPVVAFIRGFELKRGAIASSVAHDSHHIIAVGVDDKSIDTALNWVVNNNGGLCYANEKDTTGIPLPFYGLMTNDDGEKVSELYKELNHRVKENGCALDAPFMTLSFMALTVIPELKIYHNGLFDGINFKQASLFD
ncbi:MAG: adenine deaminase [Perlabentimonas sp.]